MELSKRLEHIASYVPVGAVVADIGTDHGYIPIQLVLEGRISKAYAMDVARKPLEKARDNIRAFGVERQVEVLLSDGLEGFRTLKAKDPHAYAAIDTVVVAGMGGKLMERILLEGGDLLEHVEHLILSPHLDEGAVRRTVHGLGYRIREESFLREEGKPYLVLHCTKGKESYRSRFEYRYGKRLLETLPEEYREYLRQQLEAKRRLLEMLGKTGSAGAARKAEELKEEVEELSRFLHGGTTV
ncbi:tRNA (adenine(22)-N(1))-methyltransferase [Anaerotalea alkaliphila]|uniref:SAM-dependent methyltransferase n=1 Tax=Anaerotalea alkaliphila TaxID=2662126 RepID=A0A7X5KLR1_9FIRM|nr:class I SAM-dependent methyltransferase [Anaerotalea alkaliphila]NDL66179.1 SAM-dependent methyltransferase [Anaerotalea alkaliphila]